MAGHSAIFGDRFTLVKGARSSKVRGSKAQYYPVNPPEKQEYNTDRPDYDLDNLPPRKEKQFWSTIHLLHTTTSKTRRANITKQTGISRMALSTVSPAYIHPSFNTLDIFHLGFADIMGHIWDTWNKAEQGELIYVDPEKLKAFGELVPKAMATVPPTFCGPVRDPNLKRHSQYKIYEWMALVYWFIVPIGIELEFPVQLLYNFSQYVEILDFAMTITPRTDSDLQFLHNLIKNFLLDYERLYVNNDPKKVHRCRLCVFQLIHIPKHIQWNGSLRIGSQSTMERAIGEISHSIRSKKAPYAHMANLIFERSLIKILRLKYPQLSKKSNKSSDQRLFSKQDVRKRERKFGTDFFDQLEAVCKFLKIEFDKDLELERFGKFAFPKPVLNSRLIEEKNPPTRSHRYFEAFIEHSSMPVFGEAACFIEVLDQGQSDTEFEHGSGSSTNSSMEETKTVQVVVYRRLEGLKKTLNMWKGSQWSDTLEVLPISAIQHLIGILPYEQTIYILRPHSALAMLSKDALGLGDEEEMSDEDN
ncbi:hypothetical protein FA95DRAFT_1655411 [Auriscalpium vulgare]|uniref:Uncharacterized protein n=1 Tax=Auriscalpium vulgare TaxID=40419 RepID=A0ACB8R6T5_9AGAM|nr:hypothetical protein FA95DRAFT_1655411 [Auriscalpium vulgare]